MPAAFQLPLGFAWSRRQLPVAGPAAAGGGRRELRSLRHSLARA